MWSSTAMKRNICLLNWMRWSKIESRRRKYRRSRMKEFFKMILKILQNSQEKSCAGVSILSAACKFMK